MSLMVAVLLSSQSLTDDRSSIRFPLLSLFLLPPPVFSDLLLDWSYKLFHILITRTIRSGRLFFLVSHSLCRF